MLQILVITEEPSHEGVKLSGENIDVGHGHDEEHHAEYLQASLGYNILTGWARSRL